MGKHLLSKSTFIRGLQCEKSLYLYKNHFELQDETSVMQQSVFDRGNNVGLLARKLFPGGVDATPKSHRNYDPSIELTKESIGNGTEVIYEASFRYDDVLVASDILVRDGEEWKVYEVKSSTSVSETYIHDAAVQYHVLSNSGLKISDFSIVYINSNYARNGELNLESLFAIESVLERIIPLQELVQENVARFKMILYKKEIPNVKIGMHCFSPYKCSFYGHCWKDVPANSVFDISGMHLNKKFELFNKGIVSINDIPDELELPKKQRLQVDAFKSGNTTINPVSIKEFLSGLKYPYLFLDFETFQPAVPLYNNSKPYQQIPFQYSLHIKESKDSALGHKEFLADAGSDPRIKFVENLIRDTEGEGNIIVYNKSFEITRLKEIARDFHEYEEGIAKMIRRVKDLMLPFQKKDYYAPAMNGSYSIKKVLPALIPELTYNDLEIKEGGDASIIFESLQTETDMFKIEEVRKNLLEYCKLDTFAMVEILDFLKNL